MLDFPNLTLINAGTLNPRHRPGVSLLDMANNEIQVFEFGDAAAKPGTAHELTHLKTVPLIDDTRPQWQNTQQFDGSITPHTLY